MEENVLSGGIGEEIGAYLAGKADPKRIIPVGIPDYFIPHGTIDGLKRELGLDGRSIFNRIISELSDTDKGGETA